MNLPADPWMQNLLLSLNPRQSSPFGDGFEFVAGYFDPGKYDQARFALRRTA